MNNTMILLVGKSGSGKSTIADKLNEEFGLKVLQSYTTRPKRTVDEVGHLFVTEEEFQKLDLVAKTYFDGNYYGATTQQIEKNDIYIIDKTGIESMKQLYKGKKKIITIMLLVPDLVYRQRMEIRGDSYSDIKKRIKNDEDKFKGIDDLVNFYVKNNQIHDTVDRIMKIYNTVNSTTEKRIDVNR